MISVLFYSVFVLFLFVSGLFLLFFALAFYLAGFLIGFFTFARSTDYRDDMGEFDGMGWGRGRYLSGAWPLHKMYMLFFAVIVNCVHPDLILSSCIG